MICVTRSAEPAKLSVTVVPGFADSNCSARAVNGTVSDAAANTVISPESEDAEVADAPGPALAHPARPAARPAAATRTPSRFA
jgi:hypothetical protein